MTNTDNENIIPHRNYRGRSYLDTYANRWTKKVESGKWDKTLSDPSSYVNRNKSYKKFSELTDVLFSELRPQSVLDVGCGNCQIWNVLTKYCDEKNLQGLDVSRGMINASKNKYPNSQFYLCDALDIQNNINTNIKLDAIISRGVIVNHMGKEYFSKILEQLKPYANGLIMFDYVNSKWFDEKTYRRRPKFPLYKSNDMIQLIKDSDLANKQLTIYYPNRRDPIVVLR